MCFPWVQNLSPGLGRAPGLIVLVPVHVIIAVDCLCIDVVVVFVIVAIFVVVDCFVIVVIRICKCIKNKIKKLRVVYLIRPTLKRVSFNCMILQHSLYVPCILFTSKPIFFIVLFLFLFLQLTWTLSRRERYSPR